MKKHLFLFVTLFVFLVSASALNNPYNLKPAYNGNFTPWYGMPDDPTEQPYNKVIVIEQLFYLDEDKNNDTTHIGVMDYMLFFDDNGPEGNYSNGKTLTHTFIADTGNVVLSFKEFNSEANYDYMIIYDGPVELGNTIKINGNDHLTGDLTTLMPLTVKSTSNSLTVVWKSDNLTNKSGWIATVTNSAKHYLKEKPSQCNLLAGSNINVTTESVCYGGSAELTASSTINSTQYFTWWSADKQTILKQDTVQAGGVSHFETNNQRTDKIYFVTLANDTACRADLTKEDAKYVIKDELRLNEDNIGSTTIVGASDLIPVFNDAPYMSNFPWDTPDPIYTFVAEEGHVVLKLIPFYDPEDNLDFSFFAADGTWDEFYNEDVSVLAEIYGIRTPMPMTLESSGNTMTIEWPNYSSTGGWVAYVSTSAAEKVAAEVSVPLRQPKGENDITVTSADVCYGEDAELTATSSIGFPQYYTWWDGEMGEILKQDTVQRGEVSHFQAVEQVMDSYYYVTVSNDSTCPNDLSFSREKYVVKEEVKLNSGRTTVGSSDLIPLQFDPLLSSSGSGVYVSHTFTAEEGQINLNLWPYYDEEEGAQYRLIVFDGTVFSGDRLVDIETDYPEPVNITSSGKVLTICWASESPKGGWKGYVTTTAAEKRAAEAKVTIRRPWVADDVTATNDTVCIGGIAELTASSTIGFPQYFTWYNDMGEILKQDTVRQGGISHFNTSTVNDEEHYYVSVTNDASCPSSSMYTIEPSDCAEATVFIRQPWERGAVITADTSVCFAQEAELTASSTIGFPQYFTWYNNMGGILKQDTVYEGGKSHFHTSKITEETLFYISVYNDASCSFIPDYHFIDTASVTAVKAFVREMAPLTVTNDSICYDGTANLTASSNIDFPQYFAWYNENMTEILKLDTVQQGGISHFSPSHQKSNSSYPVFVSNKDNCPFYAIDSTGTTSSLIFNGEINHKTTVVSSLDSILIYDDGGVDNNYANYQDVKHTFTTEYGHIVLQIKDFDTEQDCDNLKIYDGDNTSCLQLDNYSGHYGPFTLQSTGRSMTLYWHTDGSVTRMGWEGIITTSSNVKTPDFVAKVVLRQSKLKENILVTNDSVCYNGTADLTASSAVDFPQYYTWLDNKFTTILKQDTILTEGVSHFSPAQE